MKIAKDIYNAQNFFYKLDQFESFEAFLQN